MIYLTKKVCCDVLPNLQYFQYIVSNYTSSYLHNLYHTEWCMDNDHMKKTCVLYSNTLTKKNKVKSVCTKITGFNGYIHCIIS